ncbi:MAG: hypothetical protein K9J79_06035, partial [Desulfobacteraceae bacterium]|nr:hypothetical protein [Desulfobacteraceae bacterium]
SMANSDQQTNLFVFITPRVMADSGEAEKLYKEKKENIDPLPGESIKLYPDSQEKKDSEE